MNKIISALLLGTITIGLLAGCSTSSNSQTVSQEENQKSETIVVTHEMGETTVPISPKKVVVFDMGILDSMDALGVSAELGLPVKDIPSYLDKYKDSYSVGGLKEPNMEAIFEFKPDVIIIAARQKDFYDKLSEIAPTWYVAATPDELIKDFKDNSQTLAKIFNKENEFNNIIGDIDSKIELLAQKGNSTQEKGLILMSNDGLLSVYGKGSRFGIIHDVFNVPVADDNLVVSTHGQEVGYEYVAKINPDILFVVDRTAVVGGSVDAGTAIDNEIIRSTNAYKNNKIISLDPEVWYISGIGLNSINVMIQQVEEGLAV